MARISDIALIMKATPYRESSALVSFFGEQQGRMTAVHRGYRRKNNQQVLEPFSLVEVNLVGRGSLMTLAGCEVLERIALEGDALACGFYVYELINRGLGEQQVEEAVFGAALAALRALNEGRLSITLRRFERVLLDQLGYGLNYLFEQDGSTPIQPDQRYNYVPESGFARTGTKGAEGAQTGVTGEAILRMGDNQYDDAETAKAAREVYAQAITAVIGEQPMISRALLAPHRPA